MDKIYLKKYREIALENDNTVQYGLWTLDSGTHIKPDRTIIPIQKCIVIRFYLRI